MKTPGKIILKISSIIFILYGALYLVSSFFHLAGSSLSSLLNSPLPQFALVASGMTLVAIAIAFAAGILQIVIGIIGLKKSEKPRDSNFFITWGIILCIVEVIPLILSYRSTSLIAVILALLFVIGGVVNKRSLTSSAAAKG